MLASSFSRHFSCQVFVTIMGDIRNQIENSFDELGVTYDETILQKCLDICSKYGVTDGEEFADSWMAYSVSHFKGDNPTIQYLAKFERDEYSKKAKEVSADDDHKRSLVIYEASKMETDSDSSADILRAYNETTPRSKHYLERTTPEGPNKRSRNIAGQSQPAFSPASFSPAITTPSSQYANRVNSGEVVFRYNDDETIQDWKTTNRYDAKVQRPPDNDKQRYMSFDLIDCVDAADEAIEKLGTLICKKFNLDEPMPTSYKHPSPFITIGRISCDSDGRLNAKSVMLEGSRDLSLGEAVQLDLTNVPKYSIFPGQIVAVEGYNVTGDNLVAKEFYYDVSPPKAEPYSLPEGCLNVVIAAGPFTQSDSMTYQPLLDLIDVVSTNEPHALILTGPFIDSSHDFITGNLIAETYQDLFGKLVDKIMKPLENKKTQVFLVSSYKDCHGHCVYPTPQLPYVGKSYSKLHLIPDPSVVTIEDVTFGITSADILMHLGCEEISSHSSDRLSRLAGHMISQGSFYPLCPATKVPFDPTLIEHAKLNVTPQVLILPSDLRYFIKDVSKCLVVNPERLAKGRIGGTYARLLIAPDNIVGNIVKI